MLKNTLLTYWDLTQQVKGKANAKPLHGYKVRNLQVGCDEVAIFENLFEVVVCIGGSSGDKNEWLNNFKAYPIISGTHNGFYKSAQKVIKAVENTVDSSSKHIVWLGHSRGGAIAQVCCEYTRGVCISFGSPRPYTKKKKVYHEHTLVRSIGDDVTRQPFCWLPPFWERKSTLDIKLGRTRGLDHTAYGYLIKRDYVVNEK